MKKQVSAILFSLTLVFSFANNAEKTDSLKQLIPTLKSDTAEISLLLDIAFTYRRFETDSSLVYANKAYQLSSKINDNKNLAKCNVLLALIDYRLGNNEKALKTFYKVINSLNDIEKTKTKAYVNIGNIYADLGQYDTSIYYYNKGIEIAKIQKDKLFEANILNNIGTVYTDKGDFELAIDCYAKAEKINELIDNKSGKAAAIGNIGLIYYYQSDLQKAVTYFKKALVLNREIGKMDKVANSLNNLAAMYSLLDSMDQAIACYDESKDIYRAMNHKGGMALIAQNTANLYFLIKNTKDGLMAMDEAIKLYTELDEPKGLGKSYKSIGQHYFESSNYGLAIDNFKKAEEILTPLEVKHDLRSLYSQIAETYAKSNDHKNSTKYLKLFIAVNDSIYNSDKHKQIADIQEKYDTEKKQKEIELQQAQIAKKNIEVKQQTTQKFALGVGLFLSLGLLFIVYNGYKQKKKSNQIISLQKEEVEEKNKEISDSINYAKRIQHAIFPSDKTIAKNLKNSFIYYLPKDIVSGDFFWVENIGDNVYFAAADCTGHGVPGAMVSVVCNNALNRAVREYQITEPAKILDKIKELVIETFEESNEEVNDGMDICLCKLNTKTNELEYAGANNSLYIVRNKKLIDYKADKQPIGTHIHNNPFTNHKMDLQPNDSIYLFTDGYADQFGGKNGKKFKYKPFKELLVSISEKSLSDQKKHLSSTFNNWKGDLEQIDDICIIGIKI